MQIGDWQWDEGNLGELARHGLTLETVLQVSKESPRYRRNKRGLSALYQMIGPDSGGAIWVVCITPVRDCPGLWRAVTGWRARDHEKDWHRRSL